MSVEPSREDERVPERPAATVEERLEIVRRVFPRVAFLSDILGDRIDVPSGITLTRLREAEAALDSLAADLSRLQQERDEWRSETFRQMKVIAEAQAERGEAIEALRKIAAWGAPMYPGNTRPVSKVAADALARLGVPAA